jgi:hypothetical protein
MLLAGGGGVPWTWEAAAFLAAALCCTIATAVLTATWRAVGSSAEWARRALEFHEKAERILA